MPRARKGPSGPSGSGRKQPKASPPKGSSGSGKSKSAMTGMTKGRYK